MAAMLLLKYRRALLVALVSAVLFGWCLTSARGDNGRFLRALHERHQSDRFEAALALLNNRVRSGAPFDECSACHESKGFLTSLVFVMPPVLDSSCLRCHDTDARNPLGRVMGKRRFRPAHQLGAGQKEGRRGLLRSPDGRLAVALACTDCHPDHRGAGFVLEQKEGRKPRGRIRMRAFCVGCHVPDGGGVLEAQIRDHFIKKHEDGSFEEEPAGRDAPAILRAVGGQSCTDDGCHGEHSPVEETDD